MVLLGDFNSTTQCMDRASGKMDPTSSFLLSLLPLWNLSKLQGSHLYSFSYHHPLLHNRKSRLDRNYANIGWENQHGFSHSVSCSDHYLVGMYSLPSSTRGPTLWQFTEDLLSDQSFVTAIQHRILEFHYDNPVDSWENLKTSVQTFAQRKTKFRLKQRLRTLRSLRVTLRYING